MIALAKENDYQNSPSGRICRMAVITSDHSLATLVRQASAALGGTTTVFESIGSYFALTSSTTCIVIGLESRCQYGIDLLRQLRSASRFQPVIFISRQLSTAEAVDLMQAGAAGVLVQPISYETVLECLQRAQREEAALREIITPDSAAATHRLRSLNQQERTILELVVTGVPSKLIAMRLDLSERTIERRREALLRTFKVSSAAGLATVVAHAKFHALLMQRCGESSDKHEGREPDEADLTGEAPHISLKLMDVDRHKESTHRSDLRWSNSGCGHA